MICLFQSYYFISFFLLVQVYANLDCILLDTCFWFNKPLFEAPLLVLSCRDYNNPYLPINYSAIDGTLQVIYKKKTTAF